MKETFRDFTTFEGIWGTYFVYYPGYHKRNPMWRFNQLYDPSSEDTRLDHSKPFCQASEFYPKIDSVLRFVEQNIPKIRDFLNKERKLFGDSGLDGGQYSGVTCPPPPLY